MRAGAGNGVEDRILYIVSSTISLVMFTFSCPVGSERRLGLLYILMRRLSKTVV
jgi:hypothetical protein